MNDRMNGTTIAELHGGIRRSPSKGSGWVHRKPLSPDYETVGKTSMLHGGLVQRTKTREEKAKYAETLREQMRLKREARETMRQNLWSPPPEKDVRNLLNKLNMVTEKAFSSSLEKSPILPGPVSSRALSSPSGSFARFRHNTSPKHEREIRNEAKRKAKQTVLAQNLREQSEMIRQRKLREKEIERQEQEAFERRVEAQRLDILRKQRETEERERERRRRLFQNNNVASNSYSVKAQVSPRVRTHDVVAPPVPTTQESISRVQKQSIRSSLPSLSELVYDVRSDATTTTTTTTPVNRSPMKIIHTTSRFVMPIESSTSVHQQSFPSRSQFDDVVRSSKIPVSTFQSGDGSETESGGEEEDEKVRRVIRSPRPPIPSTSKSLDGRFNVVRVSVEEIRASIGRNNEVELPSRSVSSPISVTSNGSFTRKRSPIAASNSSLTRKSNDTNETRRSEDSISSNFRRRRNRRTNSSSSPSSSPPRRVLTLAQERALLKREEEDR